MGRYKTSPIKKMLGSERYLQLPKWLTMAAGVEITVFLCDLIDKVDMHQRGNHTNQIEFDVNGNRIRKEYGISYHRQKGIMQSLRECHILRFKKRNQRRNRKVIFKISYCCLVFWILTKLDDELRKPFFDKLKSSDILQKRINKLSRDIVEYGDYLELQKVNENIDRLNKLFAKIFKNEKKIPCIPFVNTPFFAQL